MILAGVLKAAAMHVGLHRPDILRDYSRAPHSITGEALREVIKVWCCTYIAIESVAIAEGHQPFFASDYMVEQACVASNPHMLPHRLYQAISTQAFCNKVHFAMYDVSKMDHGEAQISRASLLKMMEYDLREIERRSGSVRTYHAELDFYSASFQLRAYWLFDGIESPARKEGIIKAFNTGVKYLEILRLGEAEGHSIKYLSLLTLRVSSAMAIFISKVLHSTYREYVNIEVATNLFNFVISMYKQYSVEDNDTNGRTTKFLAQIWVIHADLFNTHPQPPSISLNSRLFFSIVHDSLWQWRDKYAGKAGNGAPNLPPPLVPSASPSQDFEATSVSRSEAAVGHPVTLFEMPGDRIGAINSTQQPIGLSTIDNQQFTGPEHFPTCDPSVWPSNTGLPHDDAQHNGALDGSGELDYEMIFPEGVVSCSEDTWYRLTRQERF
ncbi:hypothetical protein LTR84_007230 [Exophiala bonariae]|uniref:Transcription factor domain-containing protein n=1 Tax=Exophiala bonariae TaxID=1690606 RepID=A0AAV9N2J7_9EURO|nr:hypothetical protein LTR84_007230 [Exophiala bonariae]